MIGLTFNNKHSYNDFGFYLTSKQIQPPNKKKIKLSVPFMNSTYDFSTVGSNGEVTYNQRLITLNFAILKRNKQYLQIDYSKFLEWLIDTTQQQLIFDDQQDYYYLGEVEQAPTWEEIQDTGQFKVLFIAEPFKTSIDYVGSDIWDTFNFEEDITQNVAFSVSGSKDVSIYNAGRVVTPTITADSSFTLTYNSKTYNVVVGDNTFYDFKLLNGYNGINISGTGNIEFKFKKVSL